MLVYRSQLCLSRKREQCGKDGEPAQSVTIISGGERGLLRKKQVLKKKTLLAGKKFRTEAVQMSSLNLCEGGMFH